MHGPTNAKYDEFLPSDMPEDGDPNQKGPSQSNTSPEIVFPNVFLYTVVLTQ
jgi:hypothetical protein